MRRGSPAAALPYLLALFLDITRAFADPAAWRQEWPRIKECTLLRDATCFESKACDDRDHSPCVHLVLVVYAGAVGVDNAPLRLHAAGSFGDRYKERANCRVSLDRFSV